MTTPFTAVPGAARPGGFWPADPGAVRARYTTVLYPSPLSWLGIGRELTAGSPALPTNTVPVGASYEPEDTPQFLQDLGLRAAMAGDYGQVIGVEDSTFNFSGPAFLDVDGFFCDNIFGDLSSISTGTFGTPRNLSSALAIGATSLTVGVSLGAVTTGSVIQITDGAASEIVIATAGSTGTAVNFANTPCRFAHSVSATAALQTAARYYEHTFATLNNGSGQAPTHTLTDFTNITPSVGARAYPSACVARLEFGGNAEHLLTRTVSGSAFISAPAASTPTNTVSAAPPVASWRSAVSVSGTPLFNIGDWKLSLSREMVTYFSAQAGQSPWVIARGPLTAAFSMETNPAINESPLTNMTQGGLMPVVFSLSNGLAGAQTLGMTVTMSQAQTVKAKPVRTATVIGYSAEWDATANSTDVGGSGGLGPCTIQLTNAISTY